MLKKHTKSWLLAVTSVLLILAVACGPAATATPTPRPTPTPTPRLVATPTPTAAQPVPAGELKVGLERIGLAQFHPAKVSWPNESWRWAYGIHDPPAAFDQNLQTQPFLYKSWEVTPEAITIRLREGLQFHKGNGELTAEDVAFSANQAMRSDSVYVDAPQVRLAWDEWQVVDKYTVRATWKKSTPFFYLWVKWFTAASPSVVNVFSKKYLTDQGENPSLDVGTGPFEMMKFATEDRVEVEAIRNHWRQTPRVAKITFLEVREPATRIAQIKTGEVDFTEVPLAQIGTVATSGSGIKEHEMKLAGAFCALSPTGQYYQKTDPWKNNAPISSIYSRKKAEPDPKVFQEWLKTHPWIGDVDDPASMERARKVRWAMALAINKDSLVRNVLSGRGASIFTRRFIRDSEPLWLETGSHDRWTKEMPPGGDIARAKQLLTEAGFPNGFTADLIITTGARPEVEAISQAIVPMLEAAGIKVNISRIEIAAAQARGRENAWQELNVGCGSREPWPLFQQETSLQGANIQIPEWVDFVNEAGKVGASLDALRAVSTKFAEIQFKQQYSLALVQVHRFFVSGPKVGSWTIIPGPGGHPNSFETVTIVK